MFNRALLFISAAFCAIITSPAAHAEVFEISSSGNMVEITKPHWQPAAVVPNMNYLSVSAAPAAMPQTLGPQTLGPQTAGASAVRQHIQYAASRYGISSALVDAVAWQESRYNNRARSPVGAIGVMQLMPGTARQLGVVDPTNVHQNIMGGTAYLRAQLDRFGNNIPLALAAYNAGPGAVQKYGGIPPYRETQNYVRQIMGRLAQTASLNQGN
jgi:soluble lytic murein transglycosylase-like protein